ncbi:family 2 encapsulin nanocompartment cargo protein terpene cyclase [Nocardia amikacinitolerans]|uniref:family 2 encapsulin nanocompartment cargo protein terpene cyclase n=1 Tax=Nocardia amikacinitolerans TaxID=756689 RepID=UPI0020A5E9C2|nr:family 2 encapsulin nanocompartment cargo protein terpene cyclase [Nocardia amikacinitolerans]MCP2292348.1 2-methylisoborneol synthase [Nocardia amikacinitolerans]
MSVLSRAAAPAATHDLAADVVALLTNTDSTAPAELFAEAVAESPAPPTDSSPPSRTAGPTPVRLLGPRGLGSGALRLPVDRTAGPTTPYLAPDGLAIGPTAADAVPVADGAAIAPSASDTAPVADGVATGLSASVAPVGNGVRGPQSGRPDGDAANSVGPAQGAGPAESRRPPIPSAPAVPVTARVTAPESNWRAPASAPDRLRNRIPLGPSGLGTASAAVRPATAEAKPAPPRAGIGPSGLGTASTQVGGGSRIPPLYCPPPLRDDPVLAEAVNEGLLAWAEDIGLYAGRLDELRKADFGRLIMLAHPDCSDADRLLAAAKCAVSEWSVDDYYCEEDADDRAPDGTPSSPEAELGPRLELCMAVMDPAHLPARYAPQLERALLADPIMRAFRTSFEHLAQYATSAQLARLRTEIAGWFIALGAEAGWRGAGRMPPVWEYLANRQPHSFLPCMAPIDVLGGYELSAAEYTHPAMRRVTTTAALAAQMVNDLYSMAREDLSNGREFNLPTVLAAEERCSRREAVLHTAAVHDELVHRFEREAAPLAAGGSPELRRFLVGLWAWMGGNRAWHADSRRYTDVG